MIDHFGVYGENALHSLAEADLTYGDALTEPGIIARDYSTFESLQPFLVAFP